jgi:hypothetical protein
MAEDKELIRFTKEGKPTFELRHKNVMEIYDKQDKKTILKKFASLDSSTDKQSESLAFLRDGVVGTMIKRDLYPEDWSHSRENSSGLYPDVQDPHFGERLYRKQEFREAQAAAITALEDSEPCDNSMESVFEISPVQRLISRFLNPLTPYKGLLLFHGVGVGKTCTAIRVSEEYLKVYPYSKVYIIVPKSISAGFKRTIFDSSKLIKSRDGKWTSQQCTGMIYPEMALQSLAKKAKSETDFSPEDLSEEIEKKIRDRYARLGYLQFANDIKRRLKTIPSHLKGEDKFAAENLLIEKLFSDKLIIIDEAHNLRDGLAATGEEEMAALENEGDIEDELEDIDDEEVGGTKDLAIDKMGGKQLTPLLKRIVKYAKGLRLLLMSATPMYNKANEIAHLLNLLIVNDTKDDSSKNLVGDIFTKDGSLRKGGSERLRKYAQRYISYMRGENPYTFPLRLKPKGLEPVSWPKNHKVGATEKPITITKEQKEILSTLPIVSVVPTEDSPMKGLLRKILREAKPEDFKADTWVHLDVSNIVYPNEFYGSKGWDSYFATKTRGGLREFQWKGDADLAVRHPEAKSVDYVFGEEKFKHYAPKMAATIEKLNNCKGMSFVYSRYVRAGVLPMAVALERQGWTRVLNSPESKPLLSGSTKIPRRCAFCENRENTHKRDADHPFTPACYVLLTGDSLLTPNLPDILNYASNWPKKTPYAKDGGRVKAILGSQITTEGLDLKCIRGIHILDPWYHLNRLEQIIGRGIRYCSHAELDKEFRNCLIYMYAVTLPEIETPDLHAYRISATKARTIGIVQRELKIAAMDCNINIKGLIVRGAPPRLIIDGEGNTTDEYDIDDKKYTSSCDYMEECEYKCSPAVKGDPGLDSTTYTYHNAERRLEAKRKILQGLFSEEDVAIPIETIRKTVYADLPWEIASQELMKIVESPSFVVERTDGFTGYLIMRNGYLLFQPTGIRSKEIPLAYRYSRLYSILPRKTMMPKRGTVLGDVKAENGEESNAENLPKVKGLEENYKKLMKSVEEILADPENTDIHIFQENIINAEPLTWVVRRFCTLPEIRKIISDYWVDSSLNADERKQLLTLVLEGKITEPGILESLDRDICHQGEIHAFKWMNPVSFELESHCLGLGRCPGTFEPTINKTLGPAVDVRAKTGDIFGFMVPRRLAQGNDIVFKSLDKVKSKRVIGAVGSDCSVASDLGGHRERVRNIQELLQGYDSDLGKILLNDDKKAKKKKEKTGDGIIAHIDDLSHIYICLYMEILLRIMDVKNYGDMRWYLNAVEANRAGLLGR